MTSDPADRLLRAAEEVPETAPPRRHAPGRLPATARLGTVVILRKDDGSSARVRRDPNGVTPDADAAVAKASSSAGRPLPADVRTRFEASLGSDLSAVRVHTGAASADAADELGARAYTIGSDVHFADGGHAPGDPFGLHLLAHEVAHTVQQSGGPARTQCKLDVSAPGDALELEADRAADAMTSGQVFRIGAASGGARTIQREPLSLGGDRLKIIIDAKARNVAAFAAFSSATRRVAQSLKDAAKARAEMAALIADVALGFLVPGLSRGLGNLVDKLPVGSPELAYKFALKLQNADVAKAIFTGLTKAGTTLIKSSSTALFGDSSIDHFLEQWSVITQEGFQAARESLDDASDEQVVAFWAAFDASATNEATYVDQIADIVARFKAQVGAQGSERMPLEHGMHEDVLRSHVYAVRGASSEGPRLAIIDQFDLRFGGWVDNLFKGMAVDRTRELTGGRLPWIDADRVVGLNAAGAASAARPPMTGVWATNDGKLMIESEIGNEVRGQWETYHGVLIKTGPLTGVRNGNRVAGTWALDSEEERRTGRFELVLDFTQTHFAGTQTADGDPNLYPYDGALASPT